MAEKVQPRSRSLERGFDHSDGDSGSDKGANAEGPNCVVRLFSGIIAVVAYVYMFWSLVLMAPGFMINIGKYFPSLEPFFPYSIDFNKPLPGFEGLFMQIGLDVALAGFFVIPHSIFARISVKKLIGCDTCYRPLYTLMSAFQLHALQMYWQPLSAPLDFWFWGEASVTAEAGSPSTITWVLLVIYFLGYLWLVTSTFAIDHLELFGLKQGLGIDVYGMLGINSEDKVVRRLHYGVVRHPIMLGFFILFVCVPSMSFTHAFFSLACIAYCLGAVWFLEEPDLKELIGEDYNEYCQEVPAFCPFAPVCGAQKRDVKASDSDSASE